MKTNPNSTAPDDNITNSQRIGVIVNDSSRVDATGIEEKPNAGEDDVRSDEIFAAPEFFFALDSRALCRLDQLAY